MFSTLDGPQHRVLLVEAVDASGFRYGVRVRPGRSGGLGLVDASAIARAIAFPTDAHLRYVADLLLRSPMAHPTRATLLPQRLENSEYGVALTKLESAVLNRRGWLEPAQPGDARVLIAEIHVSVMKLMVRRKWAVSVSTLASVISAGPPGSQ
jgi:hypothetical protein